MFLLSNVPREPIMGRGSIWKWGFILCNVLVEPREGLSERIQNLIRRVVWFWNESALVGDRLKAVGLTVQIQCTLWSPWGTTHSPCGSESKKESDETARSNRWESNSMRQWGVDHSRFLNPAQRCSNMKFYRFLDWFFYWFCFIRAFGENRFINSGLKILDENQGNIFII